MERKDKNVAAVLAFFLGTFGVHRFYLGQIWLGILHCVFMFTGIPTIIGFIDAMVLFSMDEDRFEGKYNWRELKKSRKSRKRDRRKEWEDSFERRRRHREQVIEPWEQRHRQRRKEEEKSEQEIELQRTRRQRREMMQKKTTLKTEGIQRFKEYDYRGAIECFERVLEIDETDVAAHFNLSCAYSLNENIKKSLYHLDQAVKYGFDNFEKIRTHDALAYLRIQKEFDEFARRGFRLKEEAYQQPVEETEYFSSFNNVPLEVEAPRPDDLLQSTPDLLDQLQKLGDLKERGVLSEEEFVKEKRRLLN